MRTLDRLRGSYVHAPGWVQATGGRLLGALPPKLLYGETFRACQAEIARSGHDAAFVEVRQREELARLFAAARRTRHYAPLLAGIGPHPTLADLARLPVLDKQQVRGELAGLLARPAGEMDEVTTGGTWSMVPLTFYLDKGRSVKEWAFLTHLWQRCGYRLGDRLAVLGYRGVTHLPSPASRPWAWEPGSRELRLSPFRLIPPIMDQYLAQIERFKIAFLYGYPSAIAILAAHARALGWRPPEALRGVLLMSEAVRADQRRLIAEGFADLPVLAGYGLSEKVAIAGELPGSPDQYEFEPLYGITELLDADDRPVTVAGRRGRLIGTGFISRGMPLIRYDTGDLATAVEAPSAANHWRLRVRDITSRHCQDYLVTREGGLVSLTVLYPHNRVARECQFVQDEPGLVTMRIVPEPGVDQGQIEGLAREIDKEADGTITVRLEIVGEIPLTARGKRVMVEQRLDLPVLGSPQP